MGFFEELKDKLFPSGKNADWQEVLKRSTKEMNAQDAWAKNIPEVLTALEKAYHYQKAGIRGDWQVRLFHTPYAKGFALMYPDELGKMGFQHLFDLLRDQVIRMGYRLPNSDRRMFEKQGSVKQIERHYLKPKVASLEPPINQKYGNVLIECVLDDDNPEYIKVMVTQYSDRQYSPALEFTQFIDRLFSVPPAS